MYTKEETSISKSGSLLKTDVHCHCRMQFSKPKDMGLHLIIRLRYVIDLILLMVPIFIEYKRIKRHVVFSEWRNIKNTPL